MIAYTCNCPDFPLISFCKHICAIQRLFPRAGDADSIGDTSSIATPPSPALSMPCRAPSPPLPSSPPMSSPPPSPPPSSPLPSSPLSPSLSLPSSLPSPDLSPESPSRHVYTRMAEKLETLAAHFRQTARFPTLLDINQLDAVINEKMTKLNIGTTQSLLPTPLSLPPNQRTWTQTAAMMLPKRKTTKKRTGDPHYGAGASSGSRAKPDAKRQKVEKSIPVPIPAPPYPYALPTHIPPHPIPVSHLHSFAPSPYFTFDYSQMPR